MTDRSRRRAAAPSDSTSREDNPFAAPPEGQPDRPWQPRRGTGSRPGTDAGESGGPGGRDGSEPGAEGSDQGSGERPSSWGSQWSSRQPGRQSGGFGGSGGDGGDGGNGRGGPRGGMRWDPTDPLQRHARYSLHSGIWALFFALFSLPEVALLLGALSLYWGIDALRNKSRPRGAGSGRRGGGSGAAARAEDVAGSDRRETEEKPKAASPIPVSVTPAQAAKSRTTAAISGLITASLALAVVAATFAFQSVYRDYYTCTQDALTQSSREDCKDLLPSNLRPLLEDR
ncbi:hypothetical protein H181DRAFT_01066 [Streptomyces sp. WMMB 714]|uniref:hypothetical protein n=1 Tax=Streptomyces sp. WMMB 714 TaxID=1286822 RepID=UPI0005F7A52D|nr:hypothetical protein [Streptomyces sp. WMMB 714]SCK15760.1 hypothetical protein H181DRAFT_01066 [Streptomyces sp. WMMB 714]